VLFGVAVQKVQQLSHIFLCLIVFACFKQFVCFFKLRFMLFINELYTNRQRGCPRHIDSSLSGQSLTSPCSLQHFAKRFKIFLPIF